MKGLTLIGLVLMSASLAVADPHSDAERLYTEGQASFDAKRYDDALTAWNKSYELSREPALFFNLAQAYRLRAGTGDCAKANENYKRFIELDPSSDQRAVADWFAKETQKCAAADKVITAQPEPISTPVAVPAQNTETDASTSRQTMRIAGLSVGGAGVVLLAVGIYYGHRASSLGDEVTKSCAAGCDWGVFGAKDAEGASDGRKQYLLGGLGVAAMVGGAVLYWLGGRESSTSSVALYPRAGGATVGWSGSW